MIKNALITVLLTLAAIPGNAQTAGVSVEGATNLVAAAAKASKIGLAVDLDGTREAAYYVGFSPTFGPAAARPYVEFCLGATGKNLSGNYRLLAAPMVNVRPMIQRSFTSPFPIPDIWVGPLVRLPSFGEAWMWRTHLGGLVSVRIGGWHDRS